MSGPFKVSVVRSRTPRVIRIVREGPRGAKGLKGDKGDPGKDGVREGGVIIIEPDDPGDLTLLFNNALI